MELESALTVKEALRRPPFRDAIVIAGSEGLDRRVRWVHILDTADIDRLIHGEEMILTTGVAFQSGLSSFRDYFDNLVRQNASCLCIEPGKDFRAVPADIVAAADRFRLPLVLFPQPVRFVDITHDLHSLIISRNHKNQFLEERRLYTEHLWIDDLLHMRIKDEDQIRTLAGAEFKRLNESPYRVLFVAYGQEEPDSVGIQLSRSLRTVFEQHELQPLVALKPNGIAVLAVDRSRGRSAGANWRAALEALRHIAAEDRTVPLKLRIGVGGSRTRLLNAPASYKEAIHALDLLPAFGVNTLLFDELGVFQLLLHVADKSALDAFVRRYLGPIIEHDRAKGSDLIRTLRVYLDHDGSKKLTSQKLHIVRQSLYYRLDKIAELLGTDDLQPDHKLALQLALRAYQMQEPEAGERRE